MAGRGREGWCPLRGKKPFLALVNLRGHVYHCLLNIRYPPVASLIADATGRSPGFVTSAPRGSSFSPPAGPRIPADRDTPCLFRLHWHLFQGSPAVHTIPQVFLPPDPGVFFAGHVQRVTSPGRCSGRPYAARPSCSHIVAWSGGGQGRMSCSVRPMSRYPLFRLTDKESQR